MVDLERDPIPIFSVFGCGSSGSALLEAVLGTHPRVHSLGDLRSLPKTLAQHGAQCPCEAPLDPCCFWKPIAGSEDLEQLGIDCGPALLTEASERYARANARVLRDAWRRANDQRSDSNPDANLEWLVDTSGDRRRLGWLALDSEFDLRVIHWTDSPGRVGSTRVKNIKRFPPERQLWIDRQRMVAEPGQALASIARLGSLDPAEFDTKALSELLSPGAGHYAA